MEDAQFFGVKAIWRAMRAVLVRGKAPGKVPGNDLCKDEPLYVRPLERL